ncbi:CvpA family protein [Xylella fastidiosa]|uniref:CvpA family protein n=1 Tax=Xylella fastidiosa TaxID=2371 RepID=UPI001123AD99|nr:CvpA family protein [Xylella fastidiosa]TNW23280.1 CvpA family protein [Xylella fastidiosa subsp. pauca]
MIDLILAIIILVSALLGLLRGFVSIIISTSSWLLASWATFEFGNTASHWLASHGVPSTTEILCGYALVFVGTLMTVGAVGMLMHAGINAIRLNNIDRIFGFALGTFRGGFIACVLLLMIGYTPLAHEPVWRNSRLVPLLQPGVSWMRAKLPQRSSPLTPQRLPFTRPMINRMGLINISVSDDNQLNSRVFTPPPLSSNEHDKSHYVPVQPIFYRPTTTY